MTEMHAVIQNAHGIHVRPSTVIMSQVYDYDGDGQVSSGERQMMLGSIMDLLSMTLEQGMEVTVRVSGPDEQIVCHDLVVLFETHFDFPPRE